MARKSAALLKSTPVKLDGTSKAFLKELGKIKPVEGQEEHWERYLAAVQAHEEQTARFDAVFKLVEREGGTSNCKSWPAFLVEEKKAMVTAKTAFQSLDAYQYAVAHRFDKIGVPETELRALIGDSLSESLMLKASVNTGLLAAKVAQAIRKFTSEESVGTPPFCSDCQG